jgi:hypothetical protein
MPGESLPSTSPDDIARRLLRLGDRGDGDAIIAAVDELTSAADNRVEAIAVHLLGMAAETAKDPDAPELNGGPYELQLFDQQGDDLSIDDLGPVSRAGLRALLAMLTDRPADAAAQVRLVLANGSREDAATLLTGCLMWALDAIDATQFPGTR